MEIAAPLLTVALVSGEELGRFRASSGEDLRRQLFAVPRRLTPLRRADPRSTQLVCKDGLVSEGQVFTEDQDIQILLAPRHFAVCVLRSWRHPRATPLVMDTAQGLVTDAKGNLLELDYVFDEAADSEMIFAEFWEDMLLQSLQGRRSLLLGYGPAGSGKMHSMFGEDGLVLKTHKYLQANVTTNSVAVEFMEIITERAYDLLAEETSLEQNHRVRYGKDQVTVEGIQPRSMDVATALRTGLASRNGSRGPPFAHSSTKTSLVFNIHLSLEHLEEPSLIQFVRLPASNFPRATHATHHRPDPAVIFELKPLNAVTQVLQCLIPGRTRGFVPYRESAVTMLMSNVLRSASPQLVILGTCTGAEEDTWTTLRFLKRMRSCLSQKDAVDTETAREAPRNESEPSRDL
ncbi:Kinesin-like protein KIF18B [Durusdinium trenchii]|uniref:Kinesin-like protein KIF18B n=1 Tax=Durusdinium trenchii TaxID=1381693 RepID=A0ABP0NSU7_9DINO